MKSFQKKFCGDSGARTHALMEHTRFEWKKLDAEPTELNKSSLMKEIKKRNLDSLILIYDTIISLKIF